MKTLPVAVQVYSVREDAEKDFAGTMKKIKEIGYDGVELAGLYGLTPKEVKAAIEDAGLVALSAHVPFQELVADMEGTIAQYVEIGVKFIAIPYLMEEDRPGTPKFEGNVKLFEEIAKACKAHGIQTLYHNHDFEFQKMADGRYALDYIYDTIPADLLQTEIDTCWVKVAGEDPAAYVKKYSGRSPLVHLKDFHKEGKPANMYKLIGTDVKEEESHGVFEFRPVGYGDQDFGPILEASIEAGSQWVVVEQDESNGRSRMEAITLSREYLKEQGW